MNTPSYNELIKNIMPLAQAYTSEQELILFKQHIMAKQSQTELACMLYGNYNTGKSTTLNAILGKKRAAKISDIPETSCITAYHHNGYILYDTPGINAPIKHKKLSQEHINKCEIIIFVMSNDSSFEDENIYLEISKLVQLGKTILIVINNKKGTAINSKEAIKEMNKVNSNLSKIGDQQGIKHIEKKVSLCMIDAKTALKAKLKNKKLMLKHSQIHLLEKKIKQLIKHTGKQEIMHTLDQYIQHFIDTTINTIDTRFDAQSIRQSETLCSSLEKYKQAAHIQLKALINTHIARLHSQLIDRISAQQNEAQINAYIEQTITTLQQAIRANLQNIINTLDTKLEDFSKAEHHIDMLSTVPYFSTTDNQPSNAKTTQTTATSTIPLIPQVPPTTSVPMPIPSANPYISGLNVFISLYNSYNAHQEANKAQHDAAESQRHFLLALKNKVDQYSNELTECFLSTTQQNLNQYFDQSIHHIQMQSETLSHQAQQLSYDKQALQALSHTLSRVNG
jgi:ribosome biogenesis GTPase A